MIQYVTIGRYPNVKITKLWYIIISCAPRRREWSNNIGILALLIFCFVSNSAFAQSAEVRVDSIVEKLSVGSMSFCSNIDFNNQIVSCVVKPTIVESYQYNAWAKNGNVFITNRLVDVSSDDELAFVLAHEFSHIILGHPRSSIRNELEADHWAAKIMYRSGFRAIAAESVLTRLQARRILGFPFSLISHPSNSRRLRVIRLALQEELSGPFAKLDKSPVSAAADLARGGP